MTTFFSADFASFSLRRSLALSAMVCVLSYGANCLAQHHSGHSHSYGSGGGHQYGGGGVYNNFGIYGGSGPYGGAYNYNATRWLQRQRTIGRCVVRKWFWHSNVLAKKLWSDDVRTQLVVDSTTESGKSGMEFPHSGPAPIYNYSPSVFGYGTGVLSPNFLYGNSIANGYVGFVPSGGYDPWCQSGWPYVIGMNSYFPGTGIAPTVLMLNMNRPCSR